MRLYRIRIQVASRLFRDVWLVAYILAESRSQSEGQTLNCHYIMEIFPPSFNGTIEMVALDNDVLTTAPFVQLRHTRRTQWLTDVGLTSNLR